jgi:3-oxoacyl-[acyl-carrier-protein] synthase-1
MQLAVTALGGVSSVGLGILETCASVRAGFTRFEEEPNVFVQPPHDTPDMLEPAVTARVPELSPALLGEDRLDALAMAALRDLFATSRVGRGTWPRRTALLLAGPPATRAPRLAALPVRLAARLGLPDWAGAAVLTHGAAAAFELVAQAAAALAQGHADACLLLGVDSWLVGDALGGLDRAERLKSTRNVDGFVPGEGACALLLEPATAAGARALLRVGPVGLGHEPQPLTSDRQSSGAGLVSALRGTGGLGRPAPLVLCDLNGESYRAFEWGLVLARLAGDLEPAALVHPADCLGDVGAATGPFLLALACAAFLRGHAGAAHALAFTASDEGARSAIALAPA